MVHLEGRNMDQGSNRTEIGCKGRFACVKPFCFTRLLSDYLIEDKTDPPPFFFFLSLSILAEEELLQCCRKINRVLRTVRYWTIRVMSGVESESRRGRRALLGIHPSSSCVTTGHLASGPSVSFDPSEFCHHSWRQMWKFPLGCLLRVLQLLRVLEWRHFMVARYRGSQRKLKLSGVGWEGCVMNPY